MRKSEMALVTYKYLIRDIYMALRHRTNKTETKYRRAQGSTESLWGFLSRKERLKLIKTPFWDNVQFKSLIIWDITRYVTY